MAQPLHPDKRIDALEKRLAQREKQLDAAIKYMAELTRRIASLQAAVQANTTKISRLI